MGCLVEWMNNWKYKTEWNDSWNANNMGCKVDLKCNTEWNEMRLQSKLEWDEE